MRLTVKRLFSILDRSLEDKFETRLLRPPTKLLLRLRERCNEPGWIAFPSRAIFQAHFAPGHTSDGLDEFEHAGANAGPEIEEMGSPFLQQHFTRQNVSAG